MRDKAQALGDKEPGAFCCPGQVAPSCCKWLLWWAEVGYDLSGRRTRSVWPSEATRPRPSSPAAPTPTRRATGGRRDAGQTRRSGRGDGRWRAGGRHPCSLCPWRAPATCRRSQPTGRKGHAARSCGPREARLRSSGRNGVQSLRGRHPPPGRQSPRLEAPRWRMAHPVHRGHGWSWCCACCRARVRTDPSLLPPHQCDGPKR